MVCEGKKTRERKIRPDQELVKVYLDGTTFAYHCRM